MVSLLPPTERGFARETQYDLLAQTLRENLDIGRIYEIMGITGHDC